MALLRFPPKHHPRWRAIALLCCLAGAGCQRRNAAQTTSPEDDALPAMKQPRVTERVREVVQRPTAAARTGGGPIETAPDDEAVDLVGELATDPNDERTQEILLALAENSSPTACAALEAMYTRATDPKDRVEIVKVLGNLDTEDMQPALRLLTEALQPDAPAELRTAAAATLEELDDPRATTLWRPLLEDSDPEIKATAETMLGVPAATPEP